MDILFTLGIIAIVLAIALYVIRRDQGNTASGLGLLGVVLVIVSLFVDSARF